MYYIIPYITLTTLSRFSLTSHGITRHAERPLLCTYCFTWVLRTQAGQILGGSSQLVSNQLPRPWSSAIWKGSHNPFKTTTITHAYWSLTTWVDPPSIGYKWRYNPSRWSYKRVTVFFTPINGVMGPYLKMVGAHLETFGAFNKQQATNCWILPYLKLTNSTWEWMVGRWGSFQKWGFCLFSRAVLAGFREGTLVGDC